MNLRWLASILLSVACADLMGGQVEQKAFALVVEDANIHAD